MSASPPASNFYQLPVQISIHSVQRVNTSAACNDTQQSENLSHCNRYFSLTATLSSWIVMALSAVLQVKIIRVTTAKDDINTLSLLACKGWGIQAFILLC